MVNLEYNNRKCYNITIILQCYNYFIDGGGNIHMKKRFTQVLVLSIIFSLFIQTSAFAYDFINPDPDKNYSFSRWNAKVYAETYANYPGNSAYYNYMSSGGDCTNFVSQVLHAGGMIYLGSPNYSSINSWYYNGSNTPYRSYSWTGVTNFMQHWANYNGVGTNRAYSFKAYSLDSALYDDATYRAIYKDLYEGDVIQYKGNGGIDHSQVVHRYDSTDLFMAQHGTTADRFWSNVSLRTYLDWVKRSGYTNVTIYTIRMKRAVT